MLALTAVLLAAGGAGWWHVRHWRPARAAYPAQGAEIGARDGAIDWTELRAAGARFVYLDASAGAFAHDPGFAANLARARGAGLRAGAVHRYDPCQPAAPQAANFVALVPRDPRLLPPAVELAGLADACPQPVSDGTLTRALGAFLARVEAHAGAPAVLKLASGVEARHRLAARFDRRLWLERTWLAPDYAGRPWTLWTANAALASEAAERPLRWVVAQP